MLSATSNAGPSALWPDEGDEDWQQLAKIVLQSLDLDAARWQVAAVLAADGCEATILDFNAVGEGRRWQLRLELAAAPAAPGAAADTGGVEVVAFWYFAKERWDLEEVRRLPA